LLKAVPEFSANPEDIRDNLTYLVFNDLARLVNSLLQSNDHEELLLIFDFIEQAASTKDKEIQALFRDCFNEIALSTGQK